MIQITLYRFLSILLIILSLIILIILLFIGLIELMFSKKKIDEYMEESAKEDLIEQFYQNLDKVSTQTTGEVLECLIEMEELDKLYNQVTNKEPEFIDEVSYLRLKESVLNKIINNKIKTTEGGKKKKESYKALLDELDVCQKRYPKYNAIFVDSINTVKEQIDKKK